jgi:hypothetical protein
MADGLIRSALTEDDANKYGDPLRLFALGGGIMFFALTIYTVVIQGHPFDYIGFGGGFGLLLTALGGGLALKAKGGA